MKGTRWFAGAATAALWLVCLSTAAAASARRANQHRNPTRAGGDPPAATSTAGAASGLVATDPIRVGVYEDVPWCIHNPDGSWSGIAVDFWKSIADDLRMPYEIVDLDAKKVLVDFDQLRTETNHCDVIAHPINIATWGEERFDMTAPVYSTGLSIATRKAKGSLSLIAKNIFTIGFAKNMGILLLVIIGMGILVWAIERVHSDEFKGHPLRGIGHGVIWTIESLFGKGKSLSRSPAGRAVSLFWVIVTMLLVSSVTAQLASLLTMSQLASSINGPDDLRRVTTGATGPSGVTRALERLGIPVRVFENNEEGQAKLYGALLSGEIDAAVEDLPDLQYIAKKKYPGQLNVLPATFANHGLGFGLKRGSPLRKQVNLALLKLTAADRLRPLLMHYLGASL